MKECVLTMSYFITNIVYPKLWYLIKNMKQFY